jgi:hypothetical protein
MLPNWRTTVRKVEFCVKTCLQFAKNNSKPALTPKSPVVIICTGTTYFNNQQLCILNLWTSHDCQCKQNLLPQTALTSWFLQWRSVVFFAVRTEFLKYYLDQLQRVNHTWISVCGMHVIIRYNQITVHIKFKLTFSAQWLGKCTALTEISASTSPLHDGFYQVTKASNEMNYRATRTIRDSESSRSLIQNTDSTIFCSGCEKNREGNLGVRTAKPLGRPEHFT